MFRNILLSLLILIFSMVLTACGGEPPVKDSEDSLYLPSSHSASSALPASPTTPSDGNAADTEQENEFDMPIVQAPDVSSAYPQENATHETTQSSLTSKSDATSSQTQATSSSRVTTSSATTSRPAATTTTSRPVSGTTQTNRPTVTTKPTTDSSVTNPSDNTDFEMRVFELVNEERAKAGRKPLQWKDTLAEGAKIRAVEIQTSFSHTRPNGETCFTVAPGVRGENIAKGQTTPEAVMKAWMNSDGHRNNILSPNFQYIAVAFHQRHWVQLFG